MFVAKLFTMIVLEIGAGGGNKDTSGIFFWMEKVPRIAFALQFQVQLFKTEVTPFDQKHLQLISLQVLASLFSLHSAVCHKDLCCVIH